jgi:hypothetical protein
MRTGGHPLQLAKELFTFVVNHRHEAIPGFPWKKFKDFILGKFSKLKIFHKRREGRFSRKADSPLKKTWGFQGIDGIATENNIVET